MYTIGQVSEMFELPISTLRYYDKEGLLPNIQRSSGIRKFSDKEIEALRVIECLKKSGMELKGIKNFMVWSEMGSATYPERKELFVKQKNAVESEILKLEKVLSMLKYKCWYYDQAIIDGSEDRILAMLPDKLPDNIQEYFNHAHEDN